MNAEDLLAELRALAVAWDCCAASDRHRAGVYDSDGDSTTAMCLRAHASTERSGARELREILDRYAGRSGVAEHGAQLREAINQ
jgi:hypothetical protein